MTNVQNETSTTLLSSVSKSALDYAGKDVVLSDVLKKEIGDLNTDAQSLDAATVKVRDITYNFVARLCDAAHKMAEDDTYAVGVQKLADALLTVRKTTENPVGQVLTQTNPYLNLVRIADGKWASKVNKAGQSVIYWEPNRSSEKYASVCRFAVRNGYTGAEMLKHFTTGEEFKIQTPDGEKSVRATINAVIAEDKVQHQAAERKILSDEDWHEIMALQPLATIPLTKRLSKALAFTLSEGGLGIASIRIEGGQILLLGSAGIENGNAVLRQFKTRKDELRKAYHEAMRVPDEADILGEEFEIANAKG